MSELSVLKHLLTREFHEAERSKIHLDHISKELHPVLRTIDGWMGTTESGDLSVDDLSNLFFANHRHKIEYYHGVFDAIRANQATADTTRNLIEGLQRVSKLRELSLLAYDASEGRAALESVVKQLEGLSTNAADQTDDELDSFVSTDLVEIVNKRRDMGGLHWRLNSLNKALGPLRKGNFGFIFARPETGKTTFISSEGTFMAGQTTQPILWFNLEQEGDEVVVYMYRAALGMSLVELHRDLSGAKDKFYETTKGNLKLKDSASISKQQVEAIVAKYNPALIIFDQIDKIKGFDNDREDLRLGSIYVWARELAKSYAPVIGVCQADGTGEGQRWLTMANVANAKTSKQAEADWILGIGKVNEVGYENLRYMHLSKNKLPGGEDSDPNMRHGRWEVLIDPERARFLDLG